jgi:acetate kinase
MITHVVLFKLKDRSPEAIEATMQVLNNMKGKIDVIQDMAVGKDVLHLERSYDIALIVKFNKLDDIKIYDTHPLHEEVKLHMSKVLDGRSVSVDFES